MCGRRCHAIAGHPRQGRHQWSSGLLRTPPRLLPDGHPLFFAVQHHLITNYIPSRHAPSCEEFEIWTLAGTADVVMDDIWLFAVFAARCDKSAVQSMIEKTRQVSLLPHHQIFLADAEDAPTPGLPSLCQDKLDDVYSYPHASISTGHLWRYALVTHKNKKQSAKAICWIKDRACILRPMAFPYIAHQHRSA